VGKRRNVTMPKHTGSLATAGHRMAKFGGLVDISCPTRRTVGRTEILKGVHIITGFRMAGRKKMEFGGLVGTRAASNTPQPERPASTV
jgi:hypothetical protein